MLLWLTVAPHAAFAIDFFNLNKKSTVVLLSAPEEIEDFLNKHLKLPTEPFVNSAEEKNFLYRTQQEIRELLKSEGYFSSVITVSRESKENGNKPHLKIDPGKVTRVGEISIAFRGVIAEESRYQDRIQLLRASWSLKQKERFRSSDWEQAKSILVSMVASEEFAAAYLVTSQATVDPERAQADLSVVIDSGPVFYFGELEITGLERYQENLITASKNFKTGDVYKRETLQLFQNALQKGPQFSTVSVTISAEVAQHRAVPVQVTVTEAQSQRVAFGLGYSSNNGVRGELNYRNHNLFDRAWNLTSMLRLEQRRQTFLGTVDTLPDQNHVNYSAGASLQMTNIQNLKTIEQKIGVTRNYQTPKIQMQVGLSWQHESKQPSGGINQINEALVLDWRWRRQVVDDPFFIRRGDVTEIRIGGGVEALLSDQNFLRTYARHQTWWPVGARDTFFLRAEVGYTLADSRFGIPQEYLFRAGGIQSVRGYDFKSLGEREGNAVVGALTMVTGTAEYTHWLTQQWGAAAFVDVGNAADSWRTLHPVIGYGAGIRWRSPAGPIALDLARGHDTGNLRMHFSMTVAF